MRKIASECIFSSSVCGELSDPLDETPRGYRVREQRTDRTERDKRTCLHNLASFCCTVGDHESTCLMSLSKGALGLCISLSELFQQIYCRAVSGKLLYVLPYSIALLYEGYANEKASQLFKFSTQPKAFWI